MNKYTLCPYYEDKCDIQKCFCIKYQAYKDVQNIAIVNQELQELGISKNADLWNKIYSIQKHFASRFFETSNPTKDDTDAWNKECLICIEDELEELFDYIYLFNDETAKLVSFNSLKKEVIDVLHFVMDTFISGGITANQLMDLYLKIYNILPTKSTEKLAVAFDYAKEQLAKRFNMLLINYENDFKLKENDIRVLDYLTIKWNIDKSTANSILERLALDLLFMNREIRECISWKHWKKPNQSIDYEKLYNKYVKMFFRFLSLSAFIFDNVEDMVQAYIVKNAENIRRQKLGY